MSFDLSQIQLPPKNAQLRKLPGLSEKPTYSQVYCLTQRHLHQGTGRPVMTHLQNSASVRYADSARVRAAH